jgi:hypothetical protein
MRKKLRNKKMQKRKKLWIPISLSFVQNLNRWQTISFFLEIRNLAKVNLKTINKTFV